jgi:hypothetical protein
VLVQYTTKFSDDKLVAAVRALSANPLAKKRYSMRVADEQIALQYVTLLANRLLLVHSRLRADLPDSRTTACLRWA